MEIIVPRKILRYYATLSNWVEMIVRIFYFNRSSRWVAEAVRDNICFNSDDIIVFLDPGYLENIGHYKNIASNISTEADFRKIDYIHIVPREIKTSERKMLGIFRTNSFFYKNGTFYKWLLVKAFVYDVWKVVKCVVGLKYRKIILYYYTGHPVLIQEMLQSFQKKNLSEKIFMKFVMFYHTKGILNRDLSEVDIKLFNVINQSKRIFGNKFDFFVESDLIESLYKSQLDFKPSRLPTPLFSRKFMGDRLYEYNNDSSSLVIGFFGCSLIKHGYFFVKKLYEHIVNDSNIDVKFIVKHNVDQSNPEEIEEMNSFLRYKKNITHLRGLVSTQEYYRKISLCDIILIPHPVEYYPVQTSGQFVEAVIFRKVVVVAKGTWMDYKVRKLKNGISYDSSSETDFLTAVKKVMNNFETYKNYDDVACEEFTKDFFVEELFLKLLK